MLKLHPIEYLIKEGIKGCQFEARLGKRRKLKDLDSRLNGFCKLL